MCMLGCTKNLWISKEMLEKEPAAGLNIKHVIKKNHILFLTPKLISSLLLDVYPFNLKMIIHFL